MIPTRAEFLKSSFYLSALAYNKRNEERLKNIQELLEKANHKQKKDKQSKNRKRYINHWSLPDDDNKVTRHDLNNHENSTILDADKSESDWVFDEQDRNYALVVGELLVMKLPEEIYNRLKPYQRDAVKWVAFVGPIGGILADDMGMGKTFMTIASIGARMNVQKVRMVLVVAPTSVLGYWEDEMKKYLPKFSNRVRIEVVHGQQAKYRIKIIRNAWRNASFDEPRVIVSSWGLVTRPQSFKAFLSPTGRNWDYGIMDEAHVTKNHKSNSSKCCRRVFHKKGTKRLLLTGTPFQNNTNELWSIMHMATQGQVLGKLKDFNKLYGTPIRNARCRNASRYDIRKGKEANDELQEKLKPYVLRRRKIDFLTNELPTKHEVCVWVKPSKDQVVLYKNKVDANIALAKNILSSDRALAKSSMMCAFQVMADLRKICSHPLRYLEDSMEEKELHSIIRGSKKLELSIQMLKAFKQDGHKTLLFSQSTQNLDIIQYGLLKLGSFKVCRLDGSVSAQKRHDMVECFQNGMFDVFLISTGAGGTGLTLTRASRVILYDPSWNPSSDAQAVDRAYRIGQTNEVWVYRMYVGNSIEEKMYAKQIHKAGVEKTIFTKGSNAEERFFDKKELCKVFEQIPDGKTCEILDRFNWAQFGEDDHPNLQLVVKHPCVIGATNHTTVYSQKRKSAFSEAQNSSIDAKRLRLDHTAEESARVVSDSGENDL